MYGGLLFILIVILLSLNFFCVFLSSFFSSFFLPLLLLFHFFGGCLLTYVHNSVFDLFVYRAPFHPICVTGLDFKRTVK